MALDPTPLLAVIASEYAPPVPAAGVPERTPPENVTPAGKAPVALNVGAGLPVAVTVKEPDELTVKVVLLPLVMAGPWGSVAVPLNEMVWFALVPFRLLSVSTSDALRSPVTAGVKLMGNRQPAPAASIPGVEEPEATSGHAEAWLLFRAKFAAMLGLVPIGGIEKLSAAFPLFSSVTVCGLSLLVKPAGVDEKLSEGGSTTSTFKTWPLRLPATI